VGVSQRRAAVIRQHGKANLLPFDVEKFSAVRWRSGDPSWRATSQAAVVLGVTKIWFDQLARAGRLPHELGRDGFPPEQVAVIGKRQSGSVPLCRPLVSMCWSLRERRGVSWLLVLPALAPRHLLQFECVAVGIREVCPFDPAPEIVDLADLYTSAEKLGTRLDDVLDN
jgi:hypothetical protein